MRPGYTTPKLAPADPLPPSSMALPPEGYITFPNSITEGHVFKHRSPGETFHIPTAAEVNAWGHTQAILRYSRGQEQLGKLTQLTAETCLISNSHGCDMPSLLTWPSSLSSLHVMRCLLLGTGMYSTKLIQGTWATPVY